jgi:tRNA isopentenyl-2-thiomethyl-A-37 hydroxylase MiaE
MTDKVQKHINPKQTYLVWCASLYVSSFFLIFYMCLMKSTAGHKVHYLVLAQEIFQINAWAKIIIRFFNNMF